MMIKVKHSIFLHLLSVLLSLLLKEMAELEEDRWLRYDL